MIKINAKSEVMENGINNVKTDLHVDGRRCTITCELAGMLSTIEDAYPGMIGDALQLMIAKLRNEA